MNRTLTPKQEKFCYHVVEGGNPSQAYRVAYDAANMTPEAVSVEAARLMRNANVRARIAQLRQSLQRSLGISRATLLVELDAIREEALDQKNVKALLACIHLKAKLLGFLDSPGRPRSPADEQSFGSYLSGGNSE